MTTHPMWLLEGTPHALSICSSTNTILAFEANGLVHAVRYTHGQMSDKGLLVFDATRERHDPRWAKHELLCRDNCSAI